MELTPTGHFANCPNCGTKDGVVAYSTEDAKFVAICGTCGNTTAVYGDFVSLFNEGIYTPEPSGVYSGTNLSNTELLDYIVGVGATELKATTSSELYVELNEEGAAVSVKLGRGASATWWFPHEGDVAMVISVPSSSMRVESPLLRSKAAMDIAFRQLSQLIIQYSLQEAT